MVALASVCSGVPSLWWRPVARTAFAMFPGAVGPLSERKTARLEWSRIGARLLAPRASAENRAASRDIPPPRSVAKGSRPTELRPDRPDCPHGCSARKQHVASTRPRTPWAGSRVRQGRSGGREGARPGRLGVACRLARLAAAGGTVAATALHLARVLCRASKILAGN
jgi:hypothetical protein